MHNLTSLLHYIQIKSFGPFKRAKTQIQELGLSIGFFLATLDFVSHPVINRPGVAGAVL